MRLKKSNVFVKRKIGQEVLLIPVKQKAGISTDSIYSLNETASELWEMLDKSSDLNEASKAISDSYKEPCDKVKNEVESLVEEMIRAGILIKET